MEQTLTRGIASFCECQPKYSVWRSVHDYLQAFKHIFTSPSSVNQELKTTRSGNACIHSMHKVTKASLAYIRMQVGSITCNGTELQTKLAADMVCFDLCTSVLIYRLGDQFKAFLLKHHGAIGGS